MKTLVGLAVVFAVVAAAAPALAEKPEATPETIAAAKAETDRLIAEGGAQAFFTNETDDNVTLYARHKPSGMHCRFVMSQTNSIVLDQAANTGEAVTCRSFNKEFQVTLIVSARRLEGDGKAAYKAFGAADKAAHPREMRAPSVTAPMRDELTRALFKQTFMRWSRSNGVVHRAGMAVIDGWVLTLDASVPEEKVAASEVISDVIWVDALTGALERASERRKGAAAGS